MDEVNKRRIAEAMGCMKKAEAHLKTSILKMKFKPDYECAAMEYDRAAVCFKNSLQMEQSRDAYLKASEMHKQSGNLFHCAKCSENAAIICKEMGDNSGTLKYMNLAADDYAESGSSDLSAMALQKAAKCLEDVEPEDAIKIYHKALTVVRETDRLRMASEFRTRLIKLYLKLKRFNEAAEIIDEEIETYMEAKDVGRVSQLTIALVLVHLARDDSISAAKCFQKSLKNEEFEISEEGKVCCALISAFESGDNNQFHQIFQRPILRNMNNEYLRLMKELKSSFQGTITNGNNGAVGEDDCEDLK